jgi:anti-sigma regulatory factor (Ser/Thr protein kinase)
VRSLEGSAERVNRVLEALVAAGRALTLSPDVEDALAQIAHAVADSFGEYCEIEIIDEADGRASRRAAAGTRPAQPFDECATIAEQIRDGHKTLGSILCITAAPGGFDEIARKALAVLAIELGIVAAGRTLLQRERRVADRLQRALLPEYLPVMPGAQFHGAYRPASEEAEVGGDWFDAFRLSDRRVAISVGDVAGHGLEAAVIMGEVRQALRTVAVTTESPAAVLEHVNQIIGLRTSFGMVTAIFGIYDPVASTLSYAVAGHPPPLLGLANGLVRTLPGGSIPLGCSPTLETRDWTFTLPPNSHAIFYTDGLIENDRDLIAGERGLIESAREVARTHRSHGEYVGDPAAAILERIFTGAPNRDDVAVLVLSRTADVPRYVFSAVPIAATLARAMIVDELDKLQASGPDNFGVLLAVGEAVANAIEHAYRDACAGLIRLEVTREGSQLVFTVEDFGRWRPFLRREDRGRGFALMHAFMDGVQIHSTHESTRIVLTTRLPSQGALA